MNEIKEGDLVVSVISCCDKWYGRVFTVARSRYSDAQCEACGYLHAPQVFVGTAGQNYGIPLAWVKRIPPPEELNIVDEREELHA